jgi:hypothetical protein
MALCIEFASGHVGANRLGLHDLKCAKRGRFAYFALKLAFMGDQ